MHDHFGDQRIIKRRHAIFGIDVSIDADAGTAGQIKRRDRAGRRGKRLRVFGVDATFDRVTDHDHVVLSEAERFAFSHANLIPNNIGQRHHFSDGMLDLNPRVHLHEIETIVIVEQELEGACTGITY